MFSSIIRFGSLVLALYSLTATANTELKAFRDYYFANDKILCEPRESQSAFRQRLHELLPSSGLYQHSWMMLDKDKIKELHNSTDEKNWDKAKADDRERIVSAAHRIALRDPDLPRISKVLDFTSLNPVIEIERRILQMELAYYMEVGITTRAEQIEKLLKDFPDLSPYYWDLYFLFSKIPEGFRSDSLLAAMNRAFAKVPLGSRTKKYTSDIFLSFDEWKKWVVGQNAECPELFKTQIAYLFNEEKKFAEAEQVLRSQILEDISAYPVIVDYYLAIALVNQKKWQDAKKHVALANDSKVYLQREERDYIEKLQKWLAQREAALPWYKRYPMLMNAFAAITAFFGLFAGIGFISSRRSKKTVAPTALESDPIIESVYSPIVGPFPARDRDLIVKRCEDLGLKYSFIVDRDALQKAEEKMAMNPASYNAFRSNSFDPGILYVALETEDQVVIEKFYESMGIYR